MLPSLPLSLRRREKVFGYGRVQPLDLRAKFRILFKALERKMTPATKDVLVATLWGFRDAVTGLCFPSYETIAARAGRHRATVPRAIQALEDAHVLTWQHRLKWELVEVGGQIVRVARRSSNAYRFFDPGPVPAENQNATGPKILESNRLTEPAAPAIDPESPMERIFARWRPEVMAKGEQQEGH